MTCLTSQMSAHLSSDPPIIRLYAGFCLGVGGGGGGGGAFQSKRDNGSIVQQNMDDRICASCSCFKYSQSFCISATSLNALESK